MVINCPKKVNYFDRAGFIFPRKLIQSITAIKRIIQFYTISTRLIPPATEWNGGVTNCSKAIVSAKHFHAIDAPPPTFILEVQI